ncbi:MAG: hypothetical protein ACI9LT_001389 [Pseudoalteromonas distincta]|jgi:hypothetical protein
MTAAPAPAPQDAQAVHPLVAKAQRLAEHHRRLENAQLDAEAETALTRSRLTVALLHALEGRAAARHALRGHLVSLHQRAAVRSPRRHNRISKTLDKILLRLGTSGRALVILRSGLWTSPPGSGWAGALKDIRAYLAQGAAPASQPPALLDQAYYLHTNPDLSGAASPLLHYVASGAREGRAPHPLFDPAYYGARNTQALAASGLEALEHFVRVGAAEGRDPHPLFDLDWYVTQDPALAESGANPLAHYLAHGWRAGLSPHPLFAPDFYLAQLPLAEREGPPLVHYVTVGWRLGLKPHPLFDPAWYLRQDPKIEASGREPLSHFLLEGADRRLDPSGWFSCAAHREARGANLPHGVNPLVDYLTGGAWAVSAASPGFAAAAYLAANPDLAQGDLTPLEHWARRASHP